MMTEYYCPNCETVYNPEEPMSFCDNCGSVVFLRRKREED